MKIARLTPGIIVISEPATPFEKWDESATRKWLEQQGFDLSKPITKKEFPESNTMVFMQKEAIDG